MDHTLTLPPTRTRPATPGPLARLGADTGYVVSGFVLGVVGFVVVLTGLSAGLGLVVVWVGLPVLAATLVLARGLARVERHRLVSLQGRTVPSPAYRAVPDGAGPARRLLAPLLDPQAWLDAVWALVSFATGTVAFSVLVSWAAAALGGTTYWYWQQWLPDQDLTLAEILGLGEGRRAESLLQLGLGVVALVTLPLVARLCAVVHAGTADALLNLRARS